MIQRPQNQKRYPAGVSRTTEEHRERIESKQNGLPPRTSGSNRPDGRKRDKTPVYKK